MPGNTKDRYGMSISAGSPAAVERYLEGVDLLLSQNYGPEEKFSQAVELDEGFALAHGGMAYMHMLRVEPEQARESAARAQSLAAGISARERRQIEAIALWTQGKGPQSLALIREHLKEYPRDALLMRLAQRLYMLGCSGAGVPNFPVELLALMQSVAPHCGDDWAFLGQYAFAHHETGYLDEAMRLARQSLELNPANAVACHSVTHVYFERGDAGGGDDFLAGWLQGFDPRAPYHVHLSWHLALFQLALGRYQGALDLYESDIRPSVAAKKIAALSDSASLLWRLQLYGGAPPPMPWNEVGEQAAPASNRPGAAFRDAHAALAFAAAGDEAAMSGMLDRLRSDAEKGNLLAREIVLPLARGIDAFALGDYEESARLLEPVFPQLARIGGSHAQREVFEDTLLEAYVRAGWLDKAQEMLAERLKRRASVRDTFWLGRVQLGQGEPKQAKDSFQRANRDWAGGDSDCPEIASLNRLALSVT